MTDNQAKWVGIYLAHFVNHTRVPYWQVRAQAITRGNTDWMPHQVLLSRKTDPPSEDILSLRCEWRSNIVVYMNGQVGYTRTHHQ